MRFRMSRQGRALSPCGSALPMRRKPFVCSRVEHMPKRRQRVAPSRIMPACQADWWLLKWSCQLQSGHLNQRLATLSDTPVSGRWLGVRCKNVWSPKFRIMLRCYSLRLIKAPGHIHLMSNGIFSHMERCWHKTVEVFLPVFLNVLTEGFKIYRYHIKIYHCKE